MMLGLLFTVLLCILTMVMTEKDHLNIPGRLGKKKDPAKETRDASLDISPFDLPTDRGAQNAWTPEERAEANAHMASLEREEQRKVETPWEDKGKIVPGKVADFVMRADVYKTVVETGRLMVYRDGVYVRGEAVLLETVEDLLGNKATMNTVREVQGHVERRTYVHLEEFDPVPGWLEPITLNVANGLILLDPVTRDSQFFPHTPDYLSMLQLPVVYDPNPPPEDVAYVEQFFDDLVEPEDRALLPEYCGYTLLPGYPWKKAIIFIGDHDNGKTTFLNAWENVLGHRNVSGISLQELSSNRFAVAELYGKLANICDDMPAHAIKYTDAFKRATGDSLLRAEIKKVQDRIEFHNRAKLAFACNLIPPVTDQAGAYYSRCILVNFPYVFKRDPTVPARLDTPGCMSAMLNAAILAAFDLVENDGFSRFEDPDDVRERWGRLSDPVGRFIQDRLELEPERETSKEDVKAEYEAFIKRMNWPLQGWNYVAGLIVERMGGKSVVSTTQRQEKGARRRFFVGLKIKDEDEEEKEEEAPGKGAQTSLNECTDSPEPSLKAERTVVPRGENGSVGDDRDFDGGREPGAHTTLSVPHVHAQDTEKEYTYDDCQNDNNAHMYGSEDIVCAGGSGEDIARSVHPSPEKDAVNPVPRTMIIKGKQVVNLDDGGVKES